MKKRRSCGHAQARGARGSWGNTFQPLSSTLQAPKRPFLAGMRRRPIARAASARAYDRARPLCAHSCRSLHFAPGGAALRKKGILHHRFLKAFRHFLCFGFAKRFQHCAYDGGSSRCCPFVKSSRFGLVLIRNKGRGAVVAPFFGRNFEKIAFSPRRNAHFSKKGLKPS